LAVISSGTNEGFERDAKGRAPSVWAHSTGAVEFSRNAVPTASDARRLAPSLMWSDLFLALAVINFNNGDVGAYPFCATPPSGRNLRASAQGSPRECQNLSSGTVGRRGCSGSRRAAPSCA